MTRWEILSAWCLIPAVETNPAGRAEEMGGERKIGSEEMERQECLNKVSDGKKYGKGE